MLRREFEFEKSIPSGACQRAILAIFVLEQSQRSHRKLKRRFGREDRLAPRRSAPTRLVGENLAPPCPMPRSERRCKAQSGVEPDPSPVTGDARRKLLCRLLDVVKLGLRKRTSLPPVPKICTCEFEIPATHPAPPSAPARWRLVQSLKPLTYAACSPVLVCGSSSPPRHLRANDVVCQCVRAAA